MIKVILNRFFPLDANTVDRYFVYLEYFTLFLLLTLVLSQLQVFLGVDVWRQDSMYYVSGYGDKLQSEGRWINYIFFNWLKVLPASACIITSYMCVGAFVYIASQRVIQHWRYSLAIALLVLTVPVLSVQLEWPETLLIAFLLLPIAAIESEKIPDYIFFPIFSCLFFATYSAFYFLLPLLFVHNLNAKRFFRVCLIWGVSFLIGYVLTNLIVYKLTGKAIEVSAWRHPNPVKHFSDIITNFNTVYGFFIDHMKKYKIVVSNGVLFFSFLLLMLNMKKSNVLWATLIGFIAAFSIYISTIPLGIYVQERTTLSFWISIIFITFVLVDLSSYYLRGLGVVLMLALGIKLSNVSYASITSYADATKGLLAEVKTSGLMAPQEVDRLYLIVNGEDANKAYHRFIKNLNLTPYFSEGFMGALNWVSVFKSMGYKDIVVCINDEGGWCKDPSAYYKEQGGNSSTVKYHMFNPVYFKGDMIIGINEGFLE